jgi:hypothetical protein
MHIFIDETGSFSGFRTPVSLSLVGALIIPSSRLRSLEREYGRLRPSLPMNDNGEVKGRLLSEHHIAKLIPILHHHGALFEVVGIDLSVHSEPELLRWQARQAELITDSLTIYHDERVRDQISGFRKQFAKFKLPLMIQSILTFDLIQNILELAPMFFSQRRPEELGEFHWVIDAKGEGNTPTEWEQWWVQFILPVIQSRTLSEPIQSLPIGNYSFMKRYEIPLTPFLRRHRRTKDTGAPAMNLAMILGEHLTFSKDAQPGLEMVDITTNATRRALVGHLGKSGYGDIPTLMIHRNPTPYINLMSLLETPLAPAGYSYSAILQQFSERGRNMSTRKTARRRNWS